MSYIVLTEQGVLREYQGEAAPQPGTRVGDDVVCLVADGPDGEPLAVWQAMMVAEMAQLRRLMLN